MRYFTSDLHFADEETVHIDMRPFKNSKQSDRYIIKTWNKQAKPNDTIYVIGDFVDCDGSGYDSWRQSIRYVRRIKAKVILIIGNNEERVIKHYFNNDFNAFRDICISIGFEDVYENTTITLCGHEFYLTHKPTNCKRDMLNLFGHTHRAGGVYLPLGFNMDASMNHFRLYSENDISQLLDMKERFWDKAPNLHIKCQQ